MLITHAAAPRRRNIPLTDAQIRSAKPGARPYKLFDGYNLFLLVNPSGSKYWRQKYRFAGKEKLLSYGVYPSISLREARDKRDAARKLLDRGIEPTVARHASVDPLGTFEAVASEWLSKRGATWSVSHNTTVMARLRRYAFPVLGSRAVDKITAPELLAVLRQVEAGGHVDAAHRLHRDIGAVFRYGLAIGLVTRDTSADLRGALQPSTVRHFPALTDPAAVGRLLRDIRSYTAGHPVVRSAMLMTAYTFVRSGELRRAEWAEMDLEHALWRIRRRE